MSTRMLLASDALSKTGIGPITGGSIRADSERSLSRKDRMLPGRLFSYLGDEETNKCGNSDRNPGYLLHASRYRPPETTICPGQPQSIERRCRRRY